ncbi:MAG TPA: ComEC/Rec2 family competence protein [Deinococcales bacterium]|nr:ComEC/Rec2 family competence protein [Deinococcales bacterium]
MRVVFLNVGQGDATLIVTPDGKSALIDAGPDPDLAVRLLREQGITRLDLAVATHSDADHIGGLAEVARRFRPRVFLNNGVPGTTATFRRTVAAFQAAGSRGLVASDRTLGLGSKVQVRVLAPDPAAGANQNANSVGLLVSFAGFRAFLAGDAEPETTAYWAARYGKALAGVTVHKALHHGSRYNDTAAFLRPLGPKVVVVSVGANNPYGHPTGAALNLYRAAGAAVYRTDLNGTIAFTVRADGRYNVSTTRRGPAAPGPSGARVVGALGAPGSLPNAGRDRDCVDFRRQADAQAAFVAAGGPARDPFGLDGDRDGRACESLP